VERPERCRAVVHESCLPSAAGTSAGVAESLRARPGATTIRGPVVAPLDEQHVQATWAKARITAPSTPCSGRARLDASSGTRAGSPCDRLGCGTALPHGVRLARGRGSPVRGERVARSSPHGGRAPLSPFAVRAIVVYPTWLLPDQIYTLTFDAYGQGSPEQEDQWRRTTSVLRAGPRLSHFSTTTGLGAHTNYPHAVHFSTTGPRFPGSQYPDS
jgi:hypothetical protein